ncbi:Alpha/beta hydrolase [Sulfidibacter corallicola]|uniref:Alpha/beta hydrolase n=1 Tax=Sulfidibacter corallicola TaxID=2818388 RepID=A0A8A4TY20_SULCO|nr:alpha/beta hydrolase [Sulfidibacter corallicola]QTD53984.1 alpha/beta hydrolase [Sulfidibacter corallicola]
MPRQQPSIFRKILKWSLKGTGLLGTAAFVLLIIMLNCAGFSMKQAEIDAFFERAGLDPHYHQAEYANGKVHWVSVGDPQGQPVIFVHGSPGSWDAFIGFLGDRELSPTTHLISMDRPGYGKSDRGRATPSLIHQAAALAPILDSNRSGKPAILVGHSYGGPVIARAAMDFPDKIGGLIILAGSIDPELEKTKWFQVPAQWKIFTWMIPIDLLTTNREILPLKDELNRMLPLWSSIEVPVTVIQGLTDELVPPGNADFAERVLSRAPLEVVRLPEQGHFIPWQRQDAVRAAIRGHLQRFQDRNIERSDSGAVSPVRD